MLKECPICHNLCDSKFFYLHHIQYKPSICIKICRFCHTKIHKDKNNQFFPKDVNIRPKSNVSFKTKWVELLLLMWKKESITYHSQNIYRSVIFYKVMREFERLSWVKCENSNGSGCIEKKKWSITMTGCMVCKVAFETL